MFKKIARVCLYSLNVFCVILIILNSITIKSLRFDITTLKTQLQITQSRFAQILIWFSDFLQNSISTDSDLYSKLNQVVEILKTHSESLRRAIPPNYKLLERANLTLINNSIGAKGSGTLIKINNNYFILTVAHMIDSDSDLIVATDNVTQKTYSTHIVKYDKKVDLALLSIDLDPNDELQKYIVELSDLSPSTGDHIYVIGNPADYEDIITDGIIVKQSQTFNLISAPIFFGNSGGALIYEGKLAGVVSAITMRLSMQFTEPDEELKPFIESIPYFIDLTFGIVVNLDTIKDFLKDVQDSQGN